MPSTKQLIYAIESEPIWKLSKLLKKMDLEEVNGKKNGEAALHIACRGSFNEAVDLLVAKNGVDVNVKNIGGETPLHVAIYNNNAHAVTKILTNPQVDVNAQNSVRGTPLHYACYSNNHQIVSKLLASPGVELNLRQHDSITPLMLAALGGHEETLKLLLEDTRVDLDAKNKDGKGLEELVGLGRGDSQTQEKCLEIINSERRKRENVKLEQEQTCQDGNIATTNDELTEENAGEEEEEESVVTANEELMKGNGGEKKDGSLATLNEPKEEKKMMYSTLCWCCSKEGCKLYKCGGCRKARYCSDECLKEDWDGHGNYCLKKQQRRKKMNVYVQEAELELEGPLDLK